MRNKDRQAAGGSKDWKTVCGGHGMQIVKFEQEKDLDRLEAYLADRYLENRRAVS